MNDADRTATGISVTTSQPDTLTSANILEREIYQSALAIGLVLSSKSQPETVQWTTKITMILRTSCESRTYNPTPHANRRKPCVITTTKPPETQPEASFWTCSKRWRDRTRISTPTSRPHRFMLRSVNTLRRCITSWQISGASIPLPFLRHSRNRLWRSASIGPDALMMTGQT